MSVATLQDKLTASGARLGNYRGAETPASFGDTKAEFAALLDDPSQGLIPNASAELVARQYLGCGCFAFKKPQ